MERAWNHPKLIHVENLMDVPMAIPVPPRVQLDGNMDIMTACRTDANGLYYALYGYNRAIYALGSQNPDEIGISTMYQYGTIRGSYQKPGKTRRKRVSISLEGVGTVCQLYPWDGSKHTLAFNSSNGRMSGIIEMEEDELLLLSLEREEMGTPYKTEAQYEVKFHTLEIVSFEPDNPGETSFLRSSFAKERKMIALGKLLPWSEMEPELISFSGKGIYRGMVKLDKVEDARYVLELRHVCDTFTVGVNGKNAPFPDQDMHKAELTGLLHAGENVIDITVVSNLYNRLFSESKHNLSPMIPYRPRKYGIWSDDEEAAAIIHVLRT